MGNIRFVTYTKLAWTEGKATLLQVYRAPATCYHDGRIKEILIDEGELLAAGEAFRMLTGGETCLRVTATTCLRLAQEYETDDAPAFEWPNQLPEEDRGAVLERFPAEALAIN
jgi:hypothetical protein